MRASSILVAHARLLYPCVCLLRSLLAGGTITVLSVVVAVRAWYSCVGASPVLSCIPSQKSESRDLQLKRDWVGVSRGMSAVMTASCHVLASVSPWRIVTILFTYFFDMFGPYEAIIRLELSLNRYIVLFCIVHCSEIWLKIVPIII
jgi:hypothetical protein